MRRRAPRALLALMIKANERDDLATFLEIIAFSMHREAPNLLNNAFFFLNPRPFFP